jgi:hypothetical protein
MIFFTHNIHLDDVMFDVIRAHISNRLQDHERI